MKWHRLEIQETFKQTDSSDKGLSASEAQQRFQKVGANELVEGKKKTVAMMLLMQFKDFMILILLAAAIISGIIGVTSFIQSVHPVGQLINYHLRMQSSEVILRMGNRWH